MHTWILRDPSCILCRRNIEIDNSHIAFADASFEGWKMDPNLIIAGPQQESKTLWTKTLMGNLIKNVRWSWDDGEDYFNAFWAMQEKQPSRYDIDETAIPLPAPPHDIDMRQAKLLKRSQKAQRRRR